MVTMGGPYRLFFEFFKNSHFWPFFGGFWVKIDPKIDIFTKSGRIFSGKVQDGFQTQNGFIRSTFRGMPSLVPKFAFLLVNIGLRKPAIWAFFQKLALFTKSLSICFWFDSMRFWDVKHYSKGFFKQCSHFGAEICLFLVKKGLWGSAIWDFINKICPKSVGICSCMLI